MRDYYSNWDENRPRGDGLRTLALIGAVALLAAPAIAICARNWRARQNQARTEPAIDKTLQDTFPASDPPASRYFDIPENRL